MRAPIPIVVAATLAACAAPAAPTPAPTPVPIATLAPPRVTSQPQLAGHLLVDFGLGTVWRIDLPTGGVTPAVTSVDAFPTQASAPLSGAPIAYAGAKRVGDGMSGRFGLYVEGVLALAPDEAYSYLDPAWSGDGRSLFFTRVGIGPTEALTRATGLAILRAPASAPASAAPVVADGFQPAASYGGTMLAYTHVELTEPHNPRRSIRVRALATGLDQEVVSSDRFYDLYGPRWPPGDRAVIFAAADAPAAAAPGASADWLAQLLDAALGHRRAHAHTWSGHLWRAAIDGSGLTRLTQEEMLAPAGAPSPDGAHIAVLTLDGVWIMAADGSGLARISDSGGNGSIVWTR